MARRSLTSSCWKVVCMSTALPFSRSVYMHCARFIFNEQVYLLGLHLPSHALSTCIAQEYSANRYTCQDCICLLMLCLHELSNSIQQTCILARICVLDPIVSHRPMLCLHAGSIQSLLPVSLSKSTIHHTTFVYIYMLAQHLLHGY